MNLRLGTRGSPLALWQAEHVADGLRTHDPAIEVEIVTFTTRAENFPEQSLAAIGVGAFTKELDDALLRGDIDLAVHSSKDIPSTLPDGIALAAVLERASPFDAFVSADGTRIAQLAAGARIGTGSPRRQAQILARFPGLTVVPLRGNVATRLRKIRDEGLAGTILAVAGLTRLGQAEVITEALPIDVMVPAVGQGAVAIATRASDAATRAAVTRLEHGSTRHEIDAERAFLRELRGGCQVPAGALARVEGHSISLTAVLAAPDGSTVLREARIASLAEAADLGRGVARALIERGGDAILSRLDRPS